MNGFAALDIHPHRRYVVDIGGRRSSRCRLHTNLPYSCTHWTLHKIWECPLGSGKSNCRSDAFQSEQNSSLTSLIKTVQLFLLLSIFQCKTTVCKVRPSFCICISVLFIGTVGYCFSLKHFTILRRGNTFLLLENTAEIKRILITDNSGYFCHIVVRGFQKTDSGIDSNGQYVLHGRFHSHLLEIP